MMWIFRFDVGFTRILAVAVATLCFGIGPAGRAISGTVAVRMELDRSLLPADAPSRALVKITLAAAPAPAMASRPAVNLCLVLDRSGSMSGGKLQKAKEAAVEALRRLNEKDLFSVVVYDHQVDTVVPAQPARHTEWIEARIGDIVAGGNTALFGGVSQGAVEVRRNAAAGHVRRILLLSDGIANVGPSSPDDLGRLGTALLKEGISVTTVGVGTDYNEDLMVELSQRSDGNTYFVESSRDLPRIFAAELGDVLSVVAKNVEIRVECPEGVRPLRVIGRDGRIRGQTVILALNQLYGGQDKYALVEVEVPSVAAGRELEIARSEVRYEDPFTRRTEVGDAHVSARFSSDSEALAGAVNPSVARELQLNFKALAQEKAIELADEGETAAAADALERTAAEMESFGRRFEDRQVLEEAERIRHQAEEVRKEGWSPKSRKTLRTDAAQTKNQQAKP